MGPVQTELPAAVYKITIKKFGIFDPYERKNVKLKNGKTRELEIVLTYDLKKHPPII